MGQGIQELNKQNLWKTAFNRFEVIWSTISLQIFYRLSSTNFTLSILEYLDSNKIMKISRGILHEGV